jgi:hypothetical protein
MVVADAGTIAGKESAGLSRAGRGGVGGHRQPTGFPDMSSCSRTSGPGIQSGCGRNTSCRHCCPCAGRVWESRVGLTWRWRVTFCGRGRSRSGHRKKESATAGQPWQRQRARFLAPILPDFVTLLSECEQVLEILRVDYVLNVGGYLAEK